MCWPPAPGWQIRAEATGTYERGLSHEEDDAVFLVPEAGRANLVRKARTLQGIRVVVKKNFRPEVPDWEQVNAL
jgi:hypothetical protein